MFNMKPFVLVVCAYIVKNVLNFWEHCRIGPQDRYANHRAKLSKAGRCGLLHYPRMWEPSSIISGMVEGPNLYCTHGELECSRSVKMKVGVHYNKELGIM